MKIKSGDTAQVMYFVAVDATDFVTRKTGLSSFTVYRSRGGGAATAMTTPTVTELSSANMPGAYKLLLDEDMTITSGKGSEEMLYHITATNMAPVTRAIEIYEPKNDAVAENITYAEPAQGAPPATTSWIVKMNYLYKAWRNKSTQTATDFKLYADDATTVDHKATVSDDGTTFVRGEVATGP